MIELQSDTFAEKEDPVNREPFNDLSTQFSNAVVDKNKFGLKDVVHTANQKVSILRSELSAYENMVNEAQKAIDEIENDTGEEDGAE